MSSSNIKKNNNLSGNNRSTFSEPEFEFDLIAYKNGKFKMALLGIAFLLVYSAFFSNMTLISSIYSAQGYDNLGTISLLALYVSFGTSSLFINYVIRDVHHKVVFILSSLGYTLYSGAGIWVCFCTESSSTTGMCSSFSIYLIVNVSAVICGFCASAIWVAQGSYLMAVCLETPQRKGEFNGIFFSFNQGSQLIGSLIGCFILNNLSQIAFFMIITSVGLSAIIIFLFMPNVERVKLSTKETISLHLQVKKILKLTVSARTRGVCFLVMLSGIIVTFYSGFMSTIVAQSIYVDQSTPDGKNEISGKLSYVLICLGIFEIVSGIFSSLIGDKFDPYKLAQIGTLLCLLTGILCFVGLFTQSYLVCFFVASLWGFNDCYLQTVNYIIANQDFPTEVEIYQVYSFVTSIISALFYIASILLYNSPPFIFVAIVMTFTLLTNYFCTHLGAQNKTTLSDKL